uniref:Uncharacterized protein n=1 Tax=Tetraselmis chuii TaxID=63592 RepID=A0A7S1T4G0_9CHLO
MQVAASESDPQGKVPRVVGFQPTNPLSGVQVVPHTKDGAPDPFRELAGGSGCTEGCSGFMDTASGGLLSRVLTGRAPEFKSVDLARAGCNSGLSELTRLQETREKALGHSTSCGLAGIFSPAKDDEALPFSSFFSREDWHSAPKP